MQLKRHHRRVRLLVYHGVGHDCCTGIGGVVQARQELLLTPVKSALLRRFSLALSGNAAMMFWTGGNSGGMLPVRRTSATPRGGPSSMAISMATVFFSAFSCTRSTRAVSLQKATIEIISMRSKSSCKVGEL